MKYTKGVSVLVCCYNSSRKIIPTLAHLFQQKIKDDIDWEIILVDNGSADGTFELAKNEFDKQIEIKNIQHTLLKESKPGKSAALDKAINTAKYSYLVICDDDNWLADNYIQNAFNLMESKNDVGIIGGLSLPEFEMDEQPEWLCQYIGGYACGNPEQKETYVNDVVGAGMVIRHEVLAQINDAGFKSLLSSKRGPVITNGEDTEICKAFSFTPYKILYHPSLILRHFIPKEKMNWNYCKKLFASFQHSEVLLELYTFAHQEKFKKQLPLFYWLKKALYFSLISIKYYPKYKIQLNQEGKSEGILFLAWQLKRREYWRLNFKLNQYYKDILVLKKRLALKH